MAKRIDCLNLPAARIIRVRFKAKEDLTTKVIYRRNFSGASIVKGVSCFKKKLYRELIEYHEACNDPFPDSYLTEQEEIYIALDPVNGDEEQGVAMNPHSLFHAMTAAISHSNAENFDKPPTVCGSRKRRRTT